MIKKYDNETINISGEVFLRLYRDSPYGSLNLLKNRCLGQRPNPGGAACCLTVSMAHVWRATGQSSKRRRSELLNSQAVTDQMAAALSQPTLHWMTNAGKQRSHREAIFTWLPLCEVSAWPLRPVLALWEENPPGTGQVASLAQLDSDAKLWCWRCRQSVNQTAALTMKLDILH